MNFEKKICCDAKLSWDHRSLQKIYPRRCDVCDEELDSKCAHCDCSYFGINDNMTCSCEHKLFPYCPKCAKTFEVQNVENVKCPTCSRVYCKSDFSKS